MKKKYVFSLPQDFEDFEIIDLEEKYLEERKKF